MSDTEMEVEAPVMDLTNDTVCTKYQNAAEIVNKTLTGLMLYAKPGMSVSDCCVFGDSLITQQCANIFKSKKIEKGIAFPTCISVNDCVCHFSPLASEKDSPVIQAGDVVKVDLGCHIDGFIAVAAHTFVARAEGSSEPVTGRAADLVKAASTAAEIALRLMRPGNTNVQVTEAINKVSEQFGVKPVQGVLMHELKQFVIDGNNVVLQREEHEQKVDSFEFERYKTYTVDVVLSTGEGKPIQRDARTTVFKRAVDQEYMLKMKASRYVFNEVNKNFSTFPFSLRALSDEKQARMGVVECTKRNLFNTYPVLFEKPGDLVAHFKFTVLVMKNGLIKATGLPVDMATYSSDKVLSEDLQAILDSELKPKKGAKAAAAPAVAPAAPMETE